MYKLALDCSVLKEHTKENTEPKAKSVIKTKRAGSCAKADVAPRQVASSQSLALLSITTAVITTTVTAAVVHSFSEHHTTQETATTHKERISGPRL